MVQKRQLFVDGLGSARPLGRGVLVVHDDAGDARTQILQARQVALIQIDVEIQERDSRGAFLPGSVAEKNPGTIETLVSKKLSNPTLKCSRT